MKILLINPPRSPFNGILEHAPEEAKQFIHRKLIGPPLGLLTVAAAVSDFDTELIDLKGEYDLNPDSPSLDVMMQLILEEKRPDIIGVTFIASEFPDGIEIFRQAKRFNPEIITVAGGLHTVLAPGDFDCEWVDMVCPGPSAHMFRKLVIAAEKKTGFDNIGGLRIRTNGRLESTRVPYVSEEPAGKDFLMPDRNLLKRWLSTYKVGGNPNPVTYLFTSLGCPYECSFCSVWPQYGKGFFQRDAESVIDELKQLDDYRVVRFADANTIVNPAWISHLVQRIREEGLQKEFVMDIRFDTAVAYPGLIEQLAGIGLRVVICGFESYREEELKKYNKSASSKLIAEAIRIFHHNGIMLRGNYVIPPDYTAADFAAMAAYASGHRVVYAGYTILSPMPGTVFYGESRADIADHDLRKYNFFNSVLRTRLPKEEFYERTASLWLIKKGNDVI